MNFKRHSELDGQHAFLGASKYHWIHYDDEKLASTYLKHIATLRGTEAHEFAALCIKRRQKLPKSDITLNMYVNDAIGYGMTPEQKLVYSRNCFGTADAISFRKNLLRIHDLKTGETPAKMEQLLVYAALFCLEYKFKPADINTELRIYQSNEVLCHQPSTDEIAHVMDRIVTGDKIIEQINTEEEWS